MSQELIQQVITGHIAANWWMTPVAWEGVEPRNYSLDGAPLLAEGTEDFIVVSISFEQENSINIPHACVRLIGYIIIDINVKADTGTGAVTRYRDALNNLLQYKSLGVSIRTREFLAGGAYRILEGWVTHSAQWRFEAEYTR